MADTIVTRAVVAAEPGWCIAWPCHSSCYVVDSFTLEPVAAWLIELETIGDPSGVTHTTTTPIPVSPCHRLQEGLHLRRPDGVFLDPEGEEIDAARVLEDFRLYAALAQRVAEREAAEAEAEEARDLAIDAELERLKRAIREEG